MQFSISFLFIFFFFQLFDSLKLTLTDTASHSKNGHFYRNNNDLQAKMTEHNRGDIKIGVKVFLNIESIDYLKLSIDTLLKTLDVDFLDNLILAYHPKLSSSSSSSAAPTTNGFDHSHMNGDDPSSPIPNGKEGVLEWGDGTTNALNSLKNLWKTLEQYADEKKICQLGIADLDPDTFIELYETSTIKPTIAQINLSACCVVPSSLQEFCNKNFIQLLTHSDPEGKHLENKLSFF